MADLLTGSALDEACAVAMGWHVGDWADGGELTMLKETPSRLRQTIYELPRYSADPATDREKLEWLQKQGDDAEIMLHCLSGHWYADFSPCIRARTAKIKIAHGASVTEALARLVVAVAEVER